jgi:vacuolar-type H+-ATPase subunit F/Vma7
MNTTNFLNNENVKVLWDVVIDEDIIKRQSREFQENILNLFRSNLKGFYDVESQKTTNLVDMNKKYILLILNHANKQIKQNVNPEYRKIKILDELPQKKVNELITYEEIHNDKRSQFDKDLTKRQEEFTNAMALPVPPVPKFSDNLEDGPISEIEKAIKELTSQRNYDVEQISKSNNNNLSSNTDNWLKAQETSVKNDKLSPQQPIQNGNINGNINGNNSRLKYLKIDNENIENQVISLDREKQISPKKNVTWDLKPYNYSTEIKDELLNEVKLTMEEISENETDNNEEDANIFKLLKKVPLVKDTNDNKISVLQAEVKTLNSKLDLILELLKNKN